MRSIDLLTPLAFVVAVGAWWAEREGRLPGELGWFLAGAAALVVLHLVLRWSAVTSALSIGDRQVRYGANTLVMVLAVMGVLYLVNGPGIAGLDWTRGMIHRHNTRWDLTENQRFSLSEQTRKIVAGLEQPVTITYFQREAESSSVARDRLKEYDLLSENLSFVYVDPWKQPAVARDYDVTSVPTLVVEMGAKRERISSDAEQDLTNALIKVTRDAQKTVCFVEGEGERDPDDSGDAGYSGASQALKDSQYAVRKVLLAREKQVPADCTVVVLAGPKNDILGDTAEAVRSFVERGGKALVMADAEIDGLQPNLSLLLGGLGIDPGSDIIVDVSGMGQLFGTGPMTPIVMDYPSHQITRDLRGVMTAFHTVRSLKPGATKPEGASVSTLLQTSAASWAETDLALADPIQRDEPDTPGPISLGVVVTLPVEAARDPKEGAVAPNEGAEGDDVAGIDDPDASPESDEDDEADAPKPEGRLVALGDSDFASNSLLPFQGNKDLFLNMVAWLAEDADLISIRPKDAADQRMVLTREQRNLAVRYVPFGIPLFFVALGVVAWWRRR